MSNLLVYTQSADLLRLNKETGDPNREKYSLIYSGLKVNIQPAGLEYVVTQPDGALGKIFKCFTSYSGCQIGHVLVAGGSTTYSGSRFDIVGVEGYQGPLGKHWELLVRKSTN